MNTQLITHRQPLPWSLPVIVLVLAVHSGWSQTYEIDPARSIIRLFGSVQGVPFSPQSADDTSLKAAYSGTIQVATDGATITFTGGSLVVAGVSGNWEPKANGEAGTAPANYGARAANLLASAKAAARNFKFDITSPPIALTANNFSAAGLLFKTTPGSGATVDYVATGFINRAGTLPLERAGTNRVATVGSLHTAGDVQTLTLPMQAEFFFELISPDDTIVQLDGVLVATRQGGGGGAGENQFAGWIATRFPGVSDPAIIAPGADPDGDGILNVVEFAFGLDPMANNADFGPLDARIDPAAATVLSSEFVRPKGLLGLTYVVEAANGLSGWLPLAGSPVITDLGDGMERVAWRDTEPISNAAQRFLRLVVK